MYDSRALWLELEVRREAPRNEGWALQSSQLGVQVNVVVDAMDHAVRYRSFEGRSRIRLGNGIQLVMF